MKKKVRAIIFWPPRILAVLFVILLAKLSFDVLSPTMGRQEFLMGVLLYNIPTLVFMAIVLLSWEFELIGAVAFLLAGAGYSFYSDSLAGTKAWFPELPWGNSIIIPIFIIIGILYLINWIWKKKIKADQRKLDPR